MPTKSPEVAVNPEVLKWARESSGWTAEDIAQKLKLPAAAIKQWESGTAPPKLRHLQSLSQYYKRPLAVFLLPEPPQEPPLPTDFRVLPGRPAALHPKTRLSIRRATRLQATAQELMRELGRDIGVKLPRSAISASPEEVAGSLRKHLGIEIRQQLEWPHEWAAIEAWRRAVEDRNILVFFLPMPLKDVRGFSLSDIEPFAIVVSSSDAVHARIFTLFHECAHLILRRPGICLPGEGRERRDPFGLIEKWCNHFAGALLVPEEALGMVTKAYGISLSPERLSEFLAFASRQLKVSRQVILRRLAEFKLVHRDVYQREMDTLLAQDGRAKKGGRALPPAKKCLRDNGRLFTSLVLEARERNFIHYADVADYLSLRLNYLDSVQSALASIAA